MSFAGAIQSADAAGCIGVADDPSAFRSILRPDCAAAFWQRRLPGDVQTWLDGLDPSLLPRGRVVVLPKAVPGMVGQFCDMSGLPPGSERGWLEGDIADLAERFADLMQSKFLRLRLDVIESNACRKFHLDAITARLICTYRGTGTQYGVSEDGGEPEVINTVPTGAPILLRGSLWPEQPRSGLLHRSPPIEGTGETRLVLVLDPLSELEDDL